MQLDRKQSILILMLLAIFVHRPLIITYFANIILVFAVALWSFLKILKSERVTFSDTAGGPVSGPMSHV